MGSSEGRPENHWQAVTFFLKTLAPVFSGRPSLLPAVCLNMAELASQGVVVWRFSEEMSLWDIMRDCIFRAMMCVRFCDHAKRRTRNHNGIISKTLAVRRSNPDTEPRIEL